MQNEERVSRSQVVSKVIELLVQAMGDALSTRSLHAETELDGLGLDSLRLVELVFELEEFFDVDADEAALAQLKTVDDMVNLIWAELTQKDTDCVA